MKKLFKSMFMLTIAALAFTSCEDVPAPYDDPNNNVDPDEPGIVVEPTGDGTLANPFNVAAAVKYITDGGSEDAEMYVKGIVVSVDNGSYDPSYGSLKYYISDDGTTKDQFRVYNGYKGPNRTKFSGEDDLKPGDEVVICGKLVNFNGTKEFTTGNYTVSINGETTTEGGGDKPSDVEPLGDGTESNPYNVAAAIKYITNGGSEETEVYVKGSVVSVQSGSYDPSYGSLKYYISDDGTSNNQFLVYNGYKGPNRTKFSGEGDLKQGDEVVICGKLINYNGTKEFTTGNYLVSLNGKDPMDGEGDGDDHPTGENLLTNGDFEIWNGNIPENWKSASSASSATLSQSTDAHGGSYSVSVGFNTTQNKRLAYKEITLKPGTYVYQFYAKSTTSDPSQCQAGYVPITDGKAGSYSYLGYTSINNGDWTLVKGEFTLTETTTLCLVVMNPKTSSYATAQEILVDDASLTTANGGLE